MTQAYIDINSLPRSSVLLQSIQTVSTLHISFWSPIGQFVTGRVFLEAALQTGRGWLEMFQAELDGQSVFTVVTRKSLVAESTRQRGRSKLFSGNLSCQVTCSNVSLQPTFLIWDISFLSCIKAEVGFLDPFPDLYLREFAAECDGITQ